MPGRAPSTAWRHEHTIVFTQRAHTCTCTHKPLEIAGAPEQSNVTVSANNTASSHPITRLHGKRGLEKFYQLDRRVLHPRRSNRRSCHGTNGPQQHTTSHRQARRTGAAEPRQAPSADHARCVRRHDDAPPHPGDAHPGRRVAGLPPKNGQPPAESPSLSPGVGPRMRAVSIGHTLTRIYARAPPVDPESRRAFLTPGLQR